MNLIFIPLFYIAFQPFCEPESTTGMYYITHPVYNGSISFGSDITIVKKVNLSLATGGSSCRRDCTRNTTCLAYEFQKFTNYSECTLFRDNLCANASLLNVNASSDIKESAIWEKINGAQQPMSCLSKFMNDMFHPDATTDLAYTYNGSLPVNAMNSSEAPKLCYDYKQMGTIYNGQTVPVWPFGPENPSVKVQCYDSYTGFFLTSFEDKIFQTDYRVWALDKEMQWKPSLSQFENYINSINFTLLSHMVNLSTTNSKRLKFRLVCKECDFVWCWHEYEAVYSDFNISPNGTLELGNFTGDRNGFQPNSKYNFSASGDCGVFWQLSSNNSCSQKTYLFRFQRPYVGLKWDGLFCTKVTIMFT